MAKKYYIKTFGCQMNVYDSVRMADVLAEAGYEETDGPESADLVLLNTCHIREKAAEKVYSDIGRLKRVRDKRRAKGEEMMIGVAGCVAQAEGEAMMRRAPAIDLVIGSQSYHHLPDMIRKAQAAGRGQVELDFPEVQKFDLLPEQVRSQGKAAFVSVQEGCDKFCTFCVVPYTRGAEYSRPVTTVEKEIRALVAQGAVEISLLGQNVNAYHGEAPDGSEWSLARLLYHLAEIPGLKRLRYTTSHPCDMQEDLLKAHGELDVLMPYLHLPVQAGSDRILKAMNRKHSAAEYIDIMERLRNYKPDIAISGDFIVGFPGETEDDFEATMRLVETVFYSSAYSFKYSQRPGTPAAGSDEQVLEEVKAERLARLQGLLNAQRRSFNDITVGKIFDVLLERDGKFEGQRLGRSPYMQAVHVEGAHGLRDELVSVEIVESGNNSVAGRLVQAKMAA